MKEEGNFKSMKINNILMLPIVIYSIMILTMVVLYNTSRHYYNIIFDIWFHKSIGVVLIIALVTFITGLFISYRNNESIYKSIYRIIDAMFIEQLENMFDFVFIKDASISRTILYKILAFIRSIRFIGVFIILGPNFMCFIIIFMASIIKDYIKSENIDIDKLVDNIGFVYKENIKKFINNIKFYSALYVMMLYFVMIFGLISITEPSLISNHIPFGNILIYRVFGGFMIFMISAHIIAYIFTILSHIFNSALENELMEISFDILKYTKITLDSYLIMFDSNIITILIFISKVLFKEERYE